MLLFSDGARVDEVRHLGRQPGRKAQRQRVSDAEVRHVLGPQRLKVRRQANLATAVHLADTFTDCPPRARCRCRWRNAGRTQTTLTLDVFPSISGRTISNGVVGYVTGISKLTYAAHFARFNSRRAKARVATAQHGRHASPTSNSYLTRLYTYQHLPFHCKRPCVQHGCRSPATQGTCVPSLFDSIKNQSLSAALFCWMYLIKTVSSCHQTCMTRRVSGLPAARGPVARGAPPSAAWSMLLRHVDRREQ